MAEPAMDSAAPETPDFYAPSGPSIERVFTFYSFKGGVGRSLALYNVAVNLAESGRSVLIVDADLEAPGLSVALRQDRPGAAKEGFVELAANAANILCAAPERPNERFEEMLHQWDEARQPLPLPGEASEIGELRKRLQEAFGDRLSLPEGRLDMISAGSPYEDYPSAIAAMRLQEMFGAKPEPRHLEFAEGCGVQPPPGEPSTVGDLYALLLRRILHKTRKDRYDYILIDSRTGLADVAGLCVKGLADKLVFVTGLNRQNVHGTKEMLERLDAGQRKPENLALAVGPVPTGEADLLSERLEEAARDWGVPENRLNLLHYYPRLALIEMEFTRPYRLASIASDYRRLAERIRDMAGDTASETLPKILLADHPEGGLGSEALSQLARVALADPEGTEANIRAWYGVYGSSAKPLLRADALRVAAAISPQAVDVQGNLGVSLQAAARISKKLGEAQRLFAEAEKAFAKALEVGDRPERAHAALGGLYAAWGERLRKDAEIEAGRNLFARAEEKWAKALKIKPDMHEVPYNWGNALAGIARIEREAGDPGAARALLAQAGEKFARALEIKPDKHEAAYNWGNALLEAARIERDADDPGAARALLAQAGEKWARALEIKPDMHEAMSNWGTALLEAARIEREAGNPDAEKRLLREAEEKCLLANRIQPGSGDYNLACVRMRLGDKEGAYRLLEACLPGNPSLQAHARGDLDLEPLWNEERFKRLTGSES